MEEDEKEKSLGSRNIHAGRDIIDNQIFQGDINGSTLNVSKVSSSKTTTMSTISINNEYLEKMPKQYAQSLQEITTNINKELENEKIPSDKTAPLQQSVNELAKEMVDVKPEKGIPFEKKNNVGGKLIVFAKALVRASPKIAEIVVSLTPLAPFSRVVGTTFEEIVKSYIEKSE